MGAIKQITAPFRALVRFPLFQLAVVVGVILILQAAPETSLAGKLFSGLDRLVQATVSGFAAAFDVRSFTRSWLTSGFWIGYVYVALLLILWLTRLAFGALVDLAARTNALWLRNTIARERGIAAYRAWVPLEQIRPAHISQEAWEEHYAWPADNSPPYRPLAQRIVISGAINIAVIAAVLVALQLFTPFPVLSWLRGWFFG
jgi:hypothetical protein